MDNERNEIKSRLKKTAAPAALVLLTVFLMFYFKENRGDFGELVQKGTSDLLSFYTQNLEPLLFETDVTNEDIFNFALHQQLPINKEKKTAVILNDLGNGSTYEIQNIDDKTRLSGYKNYVEYMNLNNLQKAELDSILDSYRTEISEAVFINDQNTVAINARLADLQKALLTDIAAFSQKIDKEKMNEIMGEQFDEKEFAQAKNIIEEIKRDTSKQFIVIAQDTVFASNLYYNSKSLAKRIDSLKHNILKLRENKNLIAKVEPIKPKLPPNAPSLEDLEFKYNIDSNSTFVYQPMDMKFDDFEWTNTTQYDSLMNSLDKVQERLSNFNFDIKFDSLGNALRMKFSAFENDTLKNLDVDMDFDKLGELINKSLQGAFDPNRSEEDWEKFGVQIDSLAQQFIKVKGDTSYFNSAEFQKQMQQLQQKKNKEN